MSSFQASVLFVAVSVLSSGEDIYVDANFGHLFSRLERNFGKKRGSICPVSRANATMDVWNQSTTGGSLQRFLSVFICIFCTLDSPGKLWMCCENVCENYYSESEVLCSKCNSVRGKCWMIVIENYRFRSCSANTFVTEKILIVINIDRIMKMYLK